MRSTIDIGYWFENVGGNMYAHLPPTTY